MGGIVSTQAPGPDGHPRAGGDGDEPEVRPTDDRTSYGRASYDQPSYDQDRTSYDPKPYAGDAFGSGYPNAQPYPSGSPTRGGHPGSPDPQGGYPQAPYYRTPQTQNFPAPGAYGQQGYAPGPYGQPYMAQKSRVVAGVLGILLGALGIHRFYLGFTTIGIIQILMSTVLAVFTFGLSAIAVSIWGLVEGIMILVGARQFQRDARGVPLRD